MNDLFDKTINFKTVESSKSSIESVESELYKMDPSTVESLRA